MKKQILGIMLAATVCAMPVAAEECGEPPYDHPVVPNGETSNADEIRNARNAVVAYSAEVDEYLACMDTRGAKLLPFLTKEQQVRWDEDLADLHDVRRELQNQMNLAIRAYRRSQNNN
tara:strand:- start:262 stop:615 length:354 start_codon:yes stop_codon:yes gene_type:complete